MSRLVLDLQHRDFFSNNGFIELDGLLQEKEILAIHKSLEALMLGMPSNPNGQALASFRNLWKRDPLIKKLVLRNELSQMALDLSRKSTLRLGVDQLVSPELIPFMHFDVLTTIDDLFSIQDQVLGLILNLSAAPLDPSTEGVEYLPKNPGNGVFFKPKFPLELKSLAQTKDTIFLLITYASNRARYKFNDKDLFTHDVKKEGKAFGDALDDAAHPLMTKSSLH